RARAARDQPAMRLCLDRCRQSDDGSRRAREAQARDRYGEGDLGDRLNYLTRHARACRGHPRLSLIAVSKTWMAGTSPAMTWRVHRTLQEFCKAQATTSRPPAA